MTVRVFRSTDTGAPSLTNAAGSLLALLKACLVDGYGSKASAGWSVAFSDTGRAVLRMGSGSQRYLYVDNTAENYARVWGADTATAIDTFSDRFPTDSQESGGMYWWYSANSNATARAWIVVAAGDMLYIGLQTSTDYSWTSSSGYYKGFYCFGDFAAYGSADTFNTMIYGWSSSPPSSETGMLYSEGITGYKPRLYAVRSYSGLGGSINIGFHHNYASSGTQQWGGDGSLKYPNPADGALLMSPVWVHEYTGSQAVLRGQVRGILAPLQMVMGQDDTFQGQGTLAGKSYLVFQQSGSRVALEISDTW